MHKLFSKPIKTKRLILMPLAHEHRSQLFENWGSDPKTFESISSKPISLPETVSLMISRSIYARQNDRFYRYAVIEKQSAQAIGVMTLTPKDNGNSYEIGYSFGSKFWGQGYATEAIKFAILHLQNVSPATSTVATALLDNIGSIKALEKNGYTQGRIQPMSSVAGADSKHADKLCVQLERKLSPRLENNHSLSA